MRSACMLCGSCIAAATVAAERAARVGRSMVPAKFVESAMTVMDD